MILPDYDLVLNGPFSLSLLIARSFCTLGIVVMSILVRYATIVAIVLFGQ